MTYFVPPQRQVRELTPEQRELVMERKRAKFAQRQAELRARQQEEAAEELLKLFRKHVITTVPSLLEMFGRPEKKKVVREKRVFISEWSK